MDSTLTVVIVGLLAVAGAAALRRPLSRWSGQGEVSTSVEWHGSYTEAFQRTLDVCGALDLRITDADPDRGTLTAVVDPSLVLLNPLPVTVHATLITRDGVTTIALRPERTGLLTNRAATALFASFVRTWDRIAEQPVQRT